MRPKWICTGWKMNFILAEAQSYLSYLRGFFVQNRDALPTVFLVPPFTVFLDGCPSVVGFPLLVEVQKMH